MYSLTTHSRIDEIPADQWNRLVDPDTPFLSHEFLAALEHQGCVGEHWGWIPMHLTLRNARGEVVAAAPCYLKTNSYGEFVFDWAWADFYQRCGLAYYPKLVVASPYTPATGPRILTGTSPDRQALAHALIGQSLQLAEQLQVSSLHWLFTTEEETGLLGEHGLLPRSGCQFHWENRDYGSFDDFLGAFSSAKRKNVRRERRKVHESSIRLQQIPGNEVSGATWATFHRLYCDPFERYGGIPTLSREFFEEIGATMGERILLVLAEHEQRIVAGAFDLLGAHTLFGRHWGCFEDFDSLHFETCYYQGLEYCIHAGLTRFEPGAQGEHKISRGFLPTPTWSAHWIADERIRPVIARFLTQETTAMRQYITDLHSHSPYRHHAGTGASAGTVFTAR